MHRQKGIRARRIASEGGASRRDGRTAVRGVGHPLGLGMTASKSLQKGCAGAAGVTARAEVF